MRDFAAIDFETANNERTSVCSVGVVIVRDGEIVDTFYSLIQPEPNYYNYWCSQVHGLTRRQPDSLRLDQRVCGGRLRREQVVGLRPQRHRRRVLPADQPRRQGRPHRLDYL